MFQQEQYPNKDREDGFIKCQIQSGHQKHLYAQYSRISNGQEIIHLIAVYMWKRQDEQAPYKCLFLYPNNKESLEQCRCLYCRCLKLDVNKIFTSGLGCLGATSINVQNSSFIPANNYELGPNIKDT